MSGVAIKCPHCAMGTAVEFDALGPPGFPGLPDLPGLPGLSAKKHSPTAEYWLDAGYCNNPGCESLVIRLNRADGDVITSRYVHPQSGTRAKLDCIPPGLAEDYKEACAVLDASPQASAALARRCLQGLLREHFGIKEKQLYGAIQKATELKELPPHLVDGLDRIREIGNLASHPAYDAKFGVIVRVERGEAEWTLEILEGLFRHCYVEPREHERRTQKLRKKLGRTRAGRKSRAQKGQRGQSPPGN